MVRALGVIRTEPEQPVAVRLAELHRDLLSVMTDYKADVLAIEQVFTNANRQTAINVGRASGVVLLAAAQSGLPVVEYSPTAVKSAVCGDGRAGKTQIQDMISRRLHLETRPQPLDAADALAVALCHLQSIRMVVAG